MDPVASKPILLSLFAVAGADLRGLQEFEKTFGGPEFDRGVHVTPTRDGGFATVGITQSFGAGGEDVLLVRADAAGKILWTTTHGGEADELGWCVHETDDGFVLAGSTQSSGAGGNDFFLVKTDAQGERVWSKTYGGAKEDRCWALSPTADGGFLLVGETSSSGAGERDGLLVRTDAEGQELWTRTSGGERDDRFFAVARVFGDHGEGFLLAGQTFSEGAGDRDAYVVRTDADGVEQWSRTFGGPASDVAHSVCRTSDGDLFVTGYTTSLATDGDDPYLIRIDADGKLEWRKNFFTDAAGESMAYSVRATADGGCIFTGHVTDADGNGDLTLVKVDDRER